MLRGFKGLKYEYWNPGLGTEHVEYYMVKRGAAASVEPSCTWRSAGECVAHVLQLAVCYQ